MSTEELNGAMPFRSMAAPQRRQSPQMDTSEVVVARSQPRGKQAVSDARGLPASDCQEITRWSHRDPLAMSSPCGASGEGVSFSYSWGVPGVRESGSRALGLETLWGQMRPSSPGAILEVEGPPVTPPQAVQLRRHPEAASALGGDAVSPDTVFGLAEGGDQRRESPSNALLSPDSVFEMDMQRGRGNAVGEGALPWVPTAHTAVRLKTAPGGGAYY